ncbi:NAD(P)/FAD-dependent oxidoreductase [Opitutus sp. GAS368]|uniref:dihydrolipoyl dehydrogenase family protein n=1 Tax=Opitutus sp. GAS368 TaxID=1882749 RepID=UPI00087B89DC|nr:NAD(P)/FAD-dependent oxidoreductase [Opitutus sp. GAS368]SDS64518.1 Pyruvate/2-oxoglutarate dehydrogenase complex, dihydrolipoamide dehydrogenase (E3) component [Opitutus sp. GAS368]
MKTYDFICIGGGSAGFNAARVAAGLGQRVAVIDGARQLGGLCILRGCMPSKTLIYAAEVLHHARHAGRFGLRVTGARADMKAVHARKKRIIADFARYRVDALTGGKFDLYRAYARFLDPHTLELSDGTKLRGRHFLIGTGSKVSVPPVPGLKEAKAWTSDDVLDLDFLPKSVLVLGGGIVACELAQYLSRMGSKVTLVQRSPNILRDHSDDASCVVQQAFRDEGIELFTDTRLQSVAADRHGATVKFHHDGKLVTRRAAHLFNALGREPNTAGLNLAAAGVKTRPDGQIIINRWQQSSTPHIYAAGDCSGPHEIVHIAIEQGILAARHAVKAKGLKPVDWSLLLNVVFTDPQLATIGRLERDLDAAGVSYLTASHPFNDHGKSILMEANYGYVKIIAEPKRGRILGAEIVGKDAGELIHAFSTALALRATVRDMLRAPWYHPTLAEIVTYPLEEIADKLAK